ncbi:hypothetical protein [Amycolatopsis pittospori]|uniref:hypothetical protein n=1 Tax=Amycolatopsis pittospori TaxID=2749434 RepID=UPI0015F0F1C6|nr:hypothetical protein [Amycolatopsis pittospori]
MKHSPVHSGCQVFHFAAWRWCINRAQELLEVHESVATFHEHASLAGMEQFLTLKPAAEGRIKLIEVKVDIEYAMTKTDLSDPLIIAPLRSPSGEDFGLFPIDGWHRIYRALSEGRETLPAYLLNSAAEEAIRIPL